MQEAQYQLSYNDLHYIFTTIMFWFPYIRSRPRLSRSERLRVYYSGLQHYHPYLDDVLLSIKTLH